MTSGTGSIVRSQFSKNSKIVKLTPTQVQFFKDYGYLQVSDIFTEEELEEMSQEYDRLFREKNNPKMETSWQGKLMSKAVDNEEYSVLSIHNLEFHSKVFGKLLNNDNLLGALEGVMGTPDILLHHTKAHNKPARNGAPYLMHQDYHYFPYKNDSMTAAFINFDDAVPENGGLWIYPRSHKFGPLKDVGSIEKGEAFHYMDPKEWPIEKATPIVAKRGDVLFFSYLTLHGSYRNLSDRVRRLLLLQAFAADDEPIKDTHKSPGQGVVLRGRNDKREASHMIVTR